MTKPSVSVQVFDRIYRRSCKRRKILKEFKLHRSRHVPSKDEPVMSTSRPCENILRAECFENLRRSLSNDFRLIDEIADFGDEDEEGIFNDYSTHFVNTGKRPQNYIREAEDPSKRFKDHPKLAELFRLKDEHVAMTNSPAAYVHVC
ncbi:hypothetical protein ACOME3_001589 [Neoechinorhynchus agilis]